LHLAGPGRGSRKRVKKERSGTFALSGLGLEKRGKLRTELATEIRGKGLAGQAVSGKKGMKSGHVIMESFSGIRGLSPGSRKGKLERG